MKMGNLSEILRHFNIEVDIKDYGNGHINDTYLTQSTPRYILQRINTSIFKNPKTLMQNICLVTEFLRKKIIKNGGDPNRETLTLIKTNDKKNYYTDCDGSCYRVYKFIDRALTYESVENPNQLYLAAKAFGKFFNMLSDFDASLLYDTIENFHNTKKRYEDFLKSVEENKAQRKDSVLKEIEFAKSHSYIKDPVWDLICENKMPLRVTHNDTKLNNVLFDEKTGEGICVIDLDTVMKGSVLFDVGDTLRFAASTAAEDEKDLNKVWFDLDMYRAHTKGFLEEVIDTLTETEKEYMPFAPKLLTYETGLRFLADYLDGDIYFKTHFENQNLYRARTQFKLVEDMENKKDEIQKIFDEVYEQVLAEKKK